MPVADTEYIDYVAPGIILMAATSGALATAVGVCVDMTEGIVNRFRTMAISRASFLTGGHGHRRRGRPSTAAPSAGPYDCCGPQSACCAGQL
ncbi:hypothetical protein [Streptomyces sp. 7N604]|uniref:hypothetical protein n=1 Tax=Streptomyces sp. 7N604 TaxID=3457415 RepID=UPI003FD10C27